jgi:hypothetical protein
MLASAETAVGADEDQRSEAPIDCVGETVDLHGTEEAHLFRSIFGRGEVSPDGLAICTDDGRTTILGPDFVLGIRSDGRPNLSHGWARTVEGAQGGTQTGQVALKGRPFT